MEPSNGWHLLEWAAELFSTAVLMFLVVTAKYLAVRSGQPFSDLHARIAIVGAVAGLAVVLIAASPVGRRSGAHMNPAVTLGLFVQGAVATSDLIAYTAAQTLGAIIGFAAGRVWGSGVSLPPVDWAVIAPSPSLNTVVVLVIEAVATFVQLFIVYLLLRSERGARWAAPVAGAALTVAIISLATSSGAGFNPVRGLGPDIVAGQYPSAWTYLVGPLLGAVAAGLASVGLQRPVVTGKLQHDPDVPCYMACSLPHRPEAELAGTPAASDRKSA